MQQARACFPFPILGLDTDNECEFINESLLAYCEQEHITFTRGREGLKNDQCHRDLSRDVLPFCIERCIGRPRPADPESVETAWRQEQVIQRAVPDPVSPDQPEQEADHRAPSTHTSACTSPVLPSQHTVEARSFPAQPTTEDEATRRPATTDGVAAHSIAVPSGGPSQASHVPASHTRSHLKSSERTIEQAIQDYLEDQRSRHRCPKTLEWHETALGLFQHYLLIEHQCLLPSQITEAQVRALLADE